MSVSKGRYELGDSVAAHRRGHGHRDAFPASLVPTEIDHSVDGLAARIDVISTVDEALEVLEQLSPTTGSDWRSRTPRWRRSPT